MYCGYIVEVKNLRQHTNANKLQIATFFGNDVCVGLDVALGDVGVYFPTDGQLSEEFCQIHDLVRRKDENGKAAGGYLEPGKRNIRAIRLRGEKSDGLYMPISCLDYCFDGVPALCTLSVGDQVSVVNGHDICQKYIPVVKTPAGRTYGNKAKKRKVNTAPTFFEHEDTAQLAYNLADFRPGDLVEISLKMHGTSQRTGYVPVLKGYADSWACKVGNAFRHILNKMSGKETYEDKHDGEPIYEYDLVTGTRRVVLDDYSGGFYGSNAFREQHSEKFRGKLHKGETVYYEVVSFTDTGTPIMGVGNVPKEAQNVYGSHMTFHYGLETGSDFYVYRITLTNEDGYVVEYTPDYMRYRCEQIGVKTVPVFWSGYIPEYPGTKDDPTITAGEWIKNKAELYYDGPDPIGKTHIREGVVVRLINRPKFTAYKHKNFLFKQIAGIVANNITETNSEISEDILAEL